LRKTIQLPVEIDEILSKYLEEVQKNQGFKISKSSWVAQAIRDKIASNSTKS